MSRCYVGNLPSEPSESELSDLFCECGKITEVQVKRTISGDWYAFIHFEEADSAEVAVKKFDRVDFQGKDLRVELPFEARRNSSRDYGAPPRRGGGRDSKVPSGPRYPVRVSGIPETGSWQDLKDHFRKAGECLFADVYNDGSGVLEYPSPEMARRAVSMFDGTNFRTHQGEHGKILCDLGSSSSGRRGGNDSPGSGGECVDESSSRRTRERRRSDENGGKRRDYYGPVRSSHDYRYRGREGPYRGSGSGDYYNTSRGRSRSRSPAGAPRAERCSTQSDSRSTETRATGGGGSSSRGEAWMHCSKPSNDQARGQYETM